MNPMVRRVKPRPPLDPFIECLWRMDSPGSPHARERALPTGTVEMVFSLGATSTRVFAHENDREGRVSNGAVICGPQRGYFVLDTAQASSVIGIHFRPGGASAFLGAPSDDFADQHVPLDDVWGRAALDLRDRLAESPSDEARFALLEQILLGRLRRPLLPHPAIMESLRRLNAAPATARIDALREQAGYSPKRFIDLFRESVGLSPKVYARIQRFQAVLGCLGRGARVEWADVAADGGFYDQSHLNREFRAFAGVTPGEYRPVSPDRPSHVPVEL